MRNELTVKTQLQEDEKFDLIIHALHEMCIAIQLKLNVEDGENAETFFEGKEFDVFEHLVGTYIEFELSQARKSEKARFLAELKSASDYQRF